MTIPEVSYQVTCSCGQILSGTRQSSFQIVRCPNCGSDRFILPRSPYASDDGNIGKSPQKASGSNPWLRLWGLPILAAAVTAAALLIIYLVFLKQHNPLKDDNVKAKETRPAQERLNLAEKHMAEGNFLLAANELDSAPDKTLAPRQIRHWQQLHREASLLADLSAEPIEDTLRHAAGMSHQEWQADFPRRYQGKAFMFDIHLQRQPNGRVEADYILPAPDSVRLEWRELEVLGKLDLDQPRRVILGVRLARIDLEPPGPRWVVHFQPQSGVLLTDARAAALCCPPLGEPDALAILKSQAQMVGEKQR